MRFTTAIFADGADAPTMLALNDDPLIAGFTTNPTLMRRAGVADYVGFAREILAVIRDKPVSFEVFADDFVGMERQARIIAGWGANVFVKIPVTDTSGTSSVPLVSRLAADGIQMNVTALTTLDQVRAVADALSPATPACVSVFAGRIADAGRDPVPIMREAVAVLARNARAKLLWASPREIFNLVQAEAAGCHYITLTVALLAKLSLLGKDLAEFSLETVRMFHRDARAAGFLL